MASVLALFAAIYVLSFLTVLFMAWRAPEIDAYGRVISGLPKAGSSPSIVPDASVEPASALSRMPTRGSRSLQVVSSRF
jgi:hypothetical protein